MLDFVRCVIVAAFIGAAICNTANAHEIRPAVVTIAVAPDGRYDLTIALNLEAALAGVGPQHKDTNDAPEAKTYNELRSLSAAALETRFEAFSARWIERIALEFDGVRTIPSIAKVDIPATGNLALARISTVHLSGRVPDGAKALRWTYAKGFGSNVLRLKRGEEMFEAGWLKDGETSAAIELAGERKSKLELLGEYVSLGFTHILPKGLDHILFVLGLYLLSTSLRPLLIQVTAFTIAHSITLALGLYGVVEVASSIVEPLIALSIVYVAVENLLTSSLHPWRPFVVFGFGLLHGLGFAGVLHEIGLPRADYVTGLVGFNVGVELGQLAVIALAWMATGVWFRGRPWYRQRIVWPASATIALAGLFWTIERVFFAA